MGDADLDIWTAVLLEAPMNVAEQLGKIIDLSAPPEFLGFAEREWRKWKEGGQSAAWSLMVDGQLILHAVAMPQTLALPDALQLARMALETDNLFDTKLLRNLLAQRHWPDEVPVDEAMRVLEILDSLGLQKRLEMTLVKFARFPNPRIQSKIAKILGRCVDKVEPLEELFHHPDARVRANLIEGLSRREDIGPFQFIVERACGDQNPRVSSLALALRARLGHTWSDTMMRLRAKSKIEAVQRAAEMAAKAILPSALSTPDLAVAPAVAKVDGDSDSHPYEQP